MNAGCAWLGTEEHTQHDGVKIRRNVMWHVLASHDLDNKGWPKPTTRQGYTGSCAYGVSPRTRSVSP